MDASGYFSGERWVHRLALPAAGCVGSEETVEALCALLLDGHLRTLGEAPGRGRAVQTGLMVPWWLARGVAGNLQAGLRERNAVWVLEQWRRGALPPLAVLLDEAAGQHAGAEEGRAVSGALVAWLLRRPDSARLLAEVFERLSRGEAVTPAWLADHMPECRSGADVDGEWDRWILRQERVVFRPGTVSARAVAQLAAALLLCPGESGIPGTGDLSRGSTMRDLIERRKAAWIPQLVGAKRAELRGLAAGRGKDLQEVVGHYDRFLEALGRGKRRARLETLLTRAEASLEELAAKYGPVEERNERVGQTAQDNDR